ncbi:MAG: DNA/RNA nuclease SfsA [Ruminococcaceae bacterium]|nr:DNA/RNA nuclease SfsA [Oscillospiraceae bacterium]
MKYPKVREAVFLSRPNRFIANCLVDGEPVRVHVKNTGRCRELLLEGAKVYLVPGENEKRSTPYDLVAVEKRTSRGNILINMDSFAPNLAVYQWLKDGGIYQRGCKVLAERTYGDSRFDFYIEYGDKKAFVEVKGVTLENDGIASFPDAPTLRGIKHLKELAAALDDGYETFVVFVVQFGGCRGFRPAAELHKDFADALKEVRARGVKVLCYECNVTPDSMEISKEVKLLF